MKKTLFILLSFLSSTAFGTQSSLGFNFMAGGRYDNLRMCVATPAGVKGGPVADIMIDYRSAFQGNNTVGFKLPLMRPVLFGLAFKMLQFEPEFTFEHSFPIKNNLDFVVGPGLGASFHYGPDYTNDSHSSPREDFFAAGPFISTLFGIHFKGANQNDRIFGIRAFYVPLFSKNRDPGTVLGAAVEGHFFRSTK